jgi:hypothetical protein
VRAIGAVEIRQRLEFRVGRLLDRDEALIGVR